MKKTISLILFWGVIFLFHTADLNAQKIYFSDTTNQWREISYFGGDGPPGTYSIGDIFSKDTLVEWKGNIYSVITGYDASMLLRDDTSARKVYIKPLDTIFAGAHVTDTNEFVYMDYNMHIGDTLLMPLVFTYLGSDKLSRHILQTLDSVEIDGSWYKQFSFIVYEDDGPSNYYYYYTVTEGVGPGSGPFIMPSGLSEWGPPVLICFKNHDVIPSIFNSTCFDPLSIKDANQDEAHFQLFPNPAKDEINVRLPQSDEKEYQLQLIDLTGRVLLQSSIKNEANLDIKKINRGLYILQILENGALLQSNKLIIKP